MAYCAGELHPSGAGHGLIAGASAPTLGQAIRATGGANVAESAVDAVVCFRELYKIRIRIGEIGMTEPVFVKQLLPLPDHAQKPVIHHDHLQR